MHEKQSGKCTNDFVKNKYASSDYVLIDLAQKFSEDQVALEPDFKNALNELFQSKQNNLPTKKRFFTHEVQH